MNPTLARILWASELARNIEDAQLQYAYLCAIAGVVDEIMGRTSIDPPKE